MCELQSRTLATLLMPLDPELSGHVLYSTPSNDKGSRVICHFQAAAQD